MIRFEDEVQRVVVKEGIASDRTNKVLEEVLINIYYQGFCDCAKLNEVELDYDLDDVRKHLLRTRESYEV